MQVVRLCLLALHHHFGFQQFEDISNKLSSADISLNESLELFEKGNKIYFDLKKILDEAENKILTLEGNEFIENEDIKFE